MEVVRVGCVAAQAAPLGGMGVGRLWFVAAAVVSRWVGVRGCCCRAQLEAYTTSDRGWPLFTL